MKTIVMEAIDVVKSLGEGAGRVLALKGVSVSLKGGELTLLMGPSGSGKTTLLSVLGGMLSPTAGLVRISGRTITGLRPEELAKVRRVIAKLIPDAPHETLLTIDATTGQNGLRQALLFREAVDVTGIVLTKLDGTAKGGIALAIAQELGVPVKLIGIGEALEDLRPFDPDDFARALLEA